MNYHDLWLLSIPARHGEYIDHLFSRYTMRARHRVVWHGMSEEQVLASLNRLLADGLITVTELEWPPPVTGEFPTIIDRDFPLSLERGGQKSHSAGRQFMYFLTPEGGAEWERFALPRWDDFFSTMMANNVLEVECHTERRLPEIIKWLDVCHGYEIPVDSDVTVIRESPWYPTDWKILDEGILATAHYDERANTDETDGSIAQYCDSFEKWCAYGFSDAYCDHVVSL